MMKKYFLSAVVSLLFTAMITNYSQANSLGDTYGFSPKGMGMGNAMAAHVSDWSSVFYNIAGLGRTTQYKEGKTTNELFLGYMATLPKMDIDIPARWALNSNDEIVYYPTKGDEELDFGTLIIGTAIDLNLLYKMPDFVSSARFGLSTALNDDLSVVKINDVEPRTHNYIRYGREAQRMVLISGAGFGFMEDTFGVGFGVNASFGGEGAVMLEDLQVSTEPQSPNGQALMDLTFEVAAMVAGIYFNVGKVFDSLEGFDIGVSYRKESSLEIDPFDTAAIVKAGGIPMNLQLALFDYYQPDIIATGVSYKLKENVLLSVEFEYQTWSNYEVSSRYEINWAHILPDLDDIWVIKLGMQYDKSEKTSIYYGYYFQPSFIPDDATRGDVNWLENDKHVLSIGMKHIFDRFGGLQKKMTLTAGYQLQILEDRDVTKTDPTSLNPSYSYGGICHTFMVGIGF